ncbi:zinc finger protein 823-like [Carlito syrichta]|uniref:Zinc finger protein 823-like n=1 Tax=Carlito syrichta TaxID=1868482 RepID=A0A3Q0DWN4_CARSF|nr:zinc finger protein 823-like [Carlito syrichta]
MGSELRCPWEVCGSLCRTGTCTVSGSHRKDPGTPRNPEMKKQWEHQNSEDNLKKPKGNLRSHVIKRFCESKEDHQGGETFNQIPNGIVNKKTSRVRPHERIVSREVSMVHSSLNRYNGDDDTRHKPYQYKEYEEKSNIHNRCEKAFSYHHSSFDCPSSRQRHERMYAREKPYDCKECGKTFSCFKSLVGHMVGHCGDAPYKLCFKDMKELTLEKSHKNVRIVVKPPVRVVTV